MACHSWAARDVDSPTRRAVARLRLARVDTAWSRSRRRNTTAWSPRAPGDPRRSVERDGFDSNAAASAAHAACEPHTPHRFKGRGRIAAGGLRPESRRIEVDGRCSARTNEIDQMTLADHPKQGNDHEHQLTKRTSAPSSGASARSQPCSHEGQASPTPGATPVAGTRSEHPGGECRPDRGHYLRSTSGSSLTFRSPAAPGGTGTAGLKRHGEMRVRYHHECARQDRTAVSGSWPPTARDGDISEVPGELDAKFTG